MGAHAMGMMFFSFAIVLGVLSCRVGAVAVTGLPWVVRWKTAEKKLIEQGI